MKIAVCSFLAAAAVLGVVQAAPLDGDGDVARVQSGSESQDSEWKGISVADMQRANFRVGLAGAGAVRRFPRNNEDELISWTEPVVASGESEWKNIAIADMERANFRVGLAGAGAVREFPRKKNKDVLFETTFDEYGRVVEQKAISVDENGVSRERLLGQRVNFNQTVGHRRCHGFKHRSALRRLRFALMRLTNRIRTALGFEPIHFHRGYHKMIEALPGHNVSVRPEPSFRIQRFHHDRHHSFAARLVRAISLLGPWEGRAMAFVLGCGIGVLLRMFFVLTVIMLRAIRGTNRIALDEDEVEHIEPAEVIFVAPPAYDQQDEKTVLKQQEEASA